MEMMYGQTVCGVYGYSHLTGGYQGGQADYVRVPLGEFYPVWGPLWGLVANPTQPVAAECTPANLGQISCNVMCRGGCQPQGRTNTLVWSYYVILRANSFSSSAALTCSCQAPKCERCHSSEMPACTCCPAADANVLKVPDGMDDLDAVLLTDILPTAWHATEMGEVGPGDVVAIWGAGPGEDSTTSTLAQQVGSTSSSSTPH